MFGLDVHYKCPYCNKIIYNTIGVTQYYDYENKSVIVSAHCNKPFITEYQLDKKITDFYYIPQHKLYIVQHVKDALDEVYDPSLNEDEIIEKVIEFLKTDESNISHRNDIDKDLNDIKIVCQFELAHISQPFFSLPLTDEVKSKLVFNHTV